MHLSLKNWLKSACSVGSSYCEVIRFDRIGSLKKPIKCHAIEGQSDGGLISLSKNLVEPRAQPLSGGAFLAPQAYCFHRLAPKGIAQAISVNAISLGSGLLFFEVKTVRKCGSPLCYACA